MPGSTPGYGLPYPLGTDARRDYPAVVGEPLAEAVEVELQRLETRWFAESTRTTDETAAATVPVSPALSLAGAPAGLYLVTAAVMFSSTDASYDANYGQLVFDGVTHEDWRVDSAHQYRRSWTMTKLFAYAGGSLSVVANWRGGGFTLHKEGCFTQVVRVGA